MERPGTEGKAVQVIDQLTAANFHCRCRSLLPFNTTEAATLEAWDLDLINSETLNQTPNQASGEAFL
jgi:hypothetical protein